MPLLPPKEKLDRTRVAHAFPQLGDCLELVNELIVTGVIGLGYTV